MPYLAAVAKSVGGNYFLVYEDSTRYPLATDVDSTLPYWKCRLRESNSNVAYDLLKQWPVYEERFGSPIDVVTIFGKLPRVFMPTGCIPHHNNSQKIYRVWYLRVDNFYISLQYQHNSNVQNTVVFMNSRLVSKLRFLWDVLVYGVNKKKLHQKALRCI